MNPLKKLLQQTAVYGLSSIVGRALNYLLVPLYTRIFSQATYGIVTEMYAYVGFFIVLLTYGMETAFFRFINKRENKSQIYSTALIALIASSSIFLVVAFAFKNQIANFIQYPQNSEYIVWFAIILAFDAIGAIPFAKLRAENKAGKFAIIKLIEIGVNIGLNVFFLVICRNAADGSLLSSFYNPAIGVGYIFISNLVASIVKMILLLPMLQSIKNGFSAGLFKQMFKYAWPLIFVGLAGVVNEMLDRTLLKYLLPYDNETNMAMLGVYGACYKLSILMTLFNQAFRYAGEPFFFNMSNDKNATKIYALVLKYFTIFGASIFLIITCYMDVFKHFIGSNFWEGLSIVPILLLANLFLGIMININIWYKLTDKTSIGALVAIGGALLTAVLNIIWIPTFGYVGSAWATLIVYGLMALASYLLGQKYYPVKYPIRKIILYLGLAIGLFFVSKIFHQNMETGGLNYLLQTTLVLAYFLVVWVFEKKQLLGFIKKT